MAERHNAKGRTGNPNADRPNRKAWKKSAKAKAARASSVSNGGGAAFSRRARMGWEKSETFGTWGPVAKSNSKNNVKVTYTRVNGV